MRTPIPWFAPNGFNIVWTGETAEAVFARWLGVDRDLDIDSYSLDVDRHRVTDLDGRDLHPDAAITGNRR